MRQVPLVLSLCLASCAAPVASESTSITPPITADASPRWKERIDELYAYVDVRGDRHAILGEVARLHAVLLDRDAVISGPPFTLRDLGAPESADATTRVCFPIDASQSAPSGVSVGTLPASMVVYAQVAGRYDQELGPPTELLAFAAKMNWQVAGPVREIFLVPPRDAAVNLLVREIQIPTSP